MDDEYDVNLVMKLVLEENGFKVDSFTDASEALENFTTGLYDLVMLDVRMPAMDGFSLYEKIKKLDDKVIICFLTAAGDAYYEILKKNYPSINENCVIYKPVKKIKKLDDKVIICFLTAAGDAYYEILKKNYPSINENCVIYKPVDNESLLRRIKSVL